MNNELSKINLTGWIFGISLFIVNVIIIFIIISSASEMSGETSNPVSDSEGFLMSTYTQDVSNGEKITAFSAQTYNQTWLNFKGLSGLNISDSGLFSGNKTSITWSFWVNLTDACDGEDVFISKFNTASLRSYRFKCSEQTGNWSKMDISIYGNGLTTEASITTGLNFLEADNKFHFYTVVYSDRIVYLYKDGILNKTGTNQSAFNYVFNSTEKVYFGKYYTNTRYLNGSMDDIRIYDGNLSSSEIMYMYLEGRK